MEGSHKNKRPPILPLHRRNESKSSGVSNRLPFLGWMSDDIRNHFVAMAGEFTGTFLFLFFALSGSQVASSIPTTDANGKKPQATNTSMLLYVSLCFGFSLAVNAWVFFRISGGLFNPAVTFGMLLIGAIPPGRAALVFIAQILGAVSTSAVVEALFPGPLNVGTALYGGTSITQGLFIEMFLTAQLVFTIFMLAAEKHRGTFIAPIGIGLALFIAELTGVYFTGGAVNPARAFGPAVVTRDFPGYHWIYWLGPFLGAALAAGFYKFIKMLEYETANPGQDAPPPKDKKSSLESHRSHHHCTCGGANIASSPPPSFHDQGVATRQDTVNSSQGDPEKGNLDEGSQLSSRGYRPPTGQSATGLSDVDPASGSAHPAFGVPERDVDDSLPSIDPGLPLSDTCSLTEMPTQRSVPLGATFAANGNTSNKRGSGLAVFPPVTSGAES